MAQTAVVQLHQREIFERNVTRALASGALAGALAFFLQKLQVPVSLAFLAVAATAMACVRGDRLDRLLLAALALGLPALPWLFGLSTAWTVALAGAAAGLVMVKARVAERGEEGTLGAHRPGAFHSGATALAAGILAVAGTEVARVLSLRLADAGVPEMLCLVVSGAVISLFVGLGSLASHLALKSDPVLAHGEALLPQLSGEFAAQLGRALSLYRQCGTQMRALPRDAAREDLARTLQKLTRDAADLAGEWAGIEGDLHEGAQSHLTKEISELRRSAQSVRDAVARAHLELAAKSLEEEVVRLGEIKLKRERVLAKLKSQVALLERAWIALIGMRSSHATVRAAEMSAVSRRLNALTWSQADEAALAHEVATAAELSAAEALAADVTTFKPSVDSSEGAVIR